MSCKEEMWPVDQDALPHQSILAVNWLLSQLQSLVLRWSYNSSCS